VLVEDLRYGSSYEPDSRAEKSSLTKVVASEWEIAGG
jgi:hypothetical protein